MTMTLAQAQAYWGEAQGLVERRDEAPADALARTGWIRTLGGAEAYLGFMARTRLSAEAVDAAVSARGIQILPSVRGCIYLAPAEDTALCLWIAERLSARRNANDMARVGVEEAELEGLGEAVLEAVISAPVTTTGLRKLLPKGAIRSLGDVGKKVGISSTLPPTLRRLEFRGQLVRQPVGDRLDSERYAWAIPAENPLDGGDFSDASVGLAALAQRYLAWAGPGTQKGFAAWSGIGQREAKKALADVGAVPVQVEGIGDAFLSPDAVEPRSPSMVSWLPALDGLFAMRAVGGRVVDPAGREVEIATFGGRAGAAKLGDAKIPLSRTLSVGGRVVGLWEVDPTTLQVEARLFGPVSDAAREAMQADRVAIEQLFSQLGHGRAFSLDKDARLVARLERVRAVG